MTKSKIALSKINALPFSNQHHAPSENPSEQTKEPALSEVEWGSIMSPKRRTLREPRSPHCSGTARYCVPPRRQTRFCTFFAPNRWGAHAPSRAGEGASPSRTCSRIEIFGEGAETNTRGRVRSPFAIDSLSSRFALRCDTPPRSRSRRTVYVGRPARSILNPHCACRPLIFLLPNFYFLICFNPG
jgi:hypothetical protein